MCQHFIEADAFGVSTITKAILTKSNTNSNQCYPFSNSNNNEGKSQIEIRTKNESVLHFGLISNSVKHKKVNLHIFECQFNLEGEPHIRHGKFSQQLKPLDPTLKLQITNKSPSVIIRETYLLINGFQFQLSIAHMQQLNSVYFLYSQKDVEENIQITTSSYTNDVEFTEATVSLSGDTSFITGMNALINMIT